MRSRREKAAPAARPKAGETGNDRGVSRHWDAAGVGSLVALHGLFFWRAAIVQGVLLHSDICYFFEPAKRLLHESLRAGRLPLWSPYLFCGYPIAAEGQIAAFYPVSLLISWLLPSPAAVNWLVISHLLLAAVSMYLLARLLGLRPFGAWLAGLTFSFSGYLFAHIHHVSLVCAAAWLPLVILFVERGWREAATANGVFAAGAWAACALSGHPQTLFHVSLVVIFWMAWRWAQSTREQRRKRLAGVGRMLILVFGLGAALSAVQLWMTADLSAAAPHGQRGELAYVTSFSLLPEHLFGFISPNHEGTPAFNTYTGRNYYWEYVVYIGLLPLLLAAVGATRRRAIALSGLAAAGLALALAQGNPMYQVLRFLPGFSDFRAPARFVFLTTFAAALLAGYGWQALAQRRWLARGKRPLIVGSLVALIAAFDLISFDRTLAPLARPEAAAARNPVVEALREDRGWWRALVVPPSTIDALWVPPGGWAANPDGWAEARMLLPADVAQSYHMRIVNGYAGFTDPTMDAFLRSAYAAGEAGDARLLSVLGTRYLALPPQAALPGLRARTVGPFALYENPGALPRAFVAAEAIAASGAREAHARTIELARADRLGEWAVVEGDSGLPGDSAARGVRAELSIEEPRPERVIVRARAEGDCLLVLNERRDQGWRVRVDGERAPLLAVDAVLMGTRLPEGEHTVEFSYHPRGLIVGRWISLLGLAACCGLLLWPRLRRAS